MSQDRFLSRWSRRKAQNRRSKPVAGVAVAEAEDARDDGLQTLDVSAEAPVKTKPPARDDRAGAAPEEGAPQEPVELTEGELRRQAEELGLPDPETLGPDSDFKQFMAPDVPGQLRNLALRRLWRSNPVLANLDGLVDYGEDFTDAARVVANMQTAYQVGRGYRRDEPEEEEVAETETVEELQEAGGDPDGGQSAETDEETAEEGEDASVEIAEVEDPEGETDRRQDDGDRT
ncbi:MAG: DUF3306 domain-containing protein [Alphaproteobacteria bacterium]|nr:DUF3306 domain-containing protein [Alphaproteobacteria bacterium]